MPVTRSGHEGQSSSVEAQGFGHDAPALDIRANICHSGHSDFQGLQTARWNSNAHDPLLPSILSETEKVEQEKCLQRLN
eukprot:s644_g33.t1